jgi:hypothetical protein
MSEPRSIDLGPNGIRSNAVRINLQCRTIHLLARKAEMNSFDGRTRDTGTGLKIWPGVISFRGNWKTAEHASHHHPSWRMLDAMVR